MLTVAGERFWCTCGCNVFRGEGQQVYTCNGCLTQYQGQLMGWVKT